MIQSSISAILAQIGLQLVGTGWPESCNNFGLILGGRVLTNPAQGTSERAYIGIEDNRGTYLYIREQDNPVQLSSARLGSCSKGQAVSVQLRAVAVSNNLQNTAQHLADKLWIDFNNLSLNSPVIDNIGLAEIDPAALWTSHAEIMLAETGGTRHDSPRLSLAALDFKLSFVVKNCKLETLKIC